MKVILSVIVFVLHCATFARAQIYEIPLVLRPLPFLVPTMIDTEGVVFQTNESSCGPAALANLLTLLGTRPYTEEEILRYMTLPPDGASMYDLEKVSERLGFFIEGLKTDPSDFQEALVPRFPCIVQLSTMGSDHFTVVVGWKGCKIFLRDSQFGNCEMNISDFKELWTGLLLSVEHREDLPMQPDKMLFKP